MFLFEDDESKKKVMKILYSAWRKEFNHEKLYPKATIIRSFVWKKEREKLLLEENSVYGLDRKTC